MPAVRHIMVHNDLGHPLCAHLRDGPWALDYVHARLEKFVPFRHFFHFFGDCLADYETQADRTFPSSGKASRLAQGAF